MLRISKLADYGTLLLSTIASAPKRIYTSKALASQTHIALPTVSKLLKQFTRAGLLQSQRGAQGGYRLARAPTMISVAEVIAAIDGRMAMTECSLHSSNCSLEAMCQVRGHWQIINEAIETALDSLTLADMIRTRMQPILVDVSHLKSLAQAEQVVE